MKMRKIRTESLNELELNWLRPMYNHNSRSVGINYEYFREDLFDTDNTWIYLARVQKTCLFGRYEAKADSMICIRRTAESKYEVELCGKSTVNTVIAKLPLSAIQQRLNVLEFRDDDFTCQPNPFGDGVKVKRRRSK